MKEDRTKRAARAEVNAVDGDVEVVPGIGTGGTADMVGYCEPGTIFLRG